MIRECTDADLAAMAAVINAAAEAYRGVIPEDCWHEPYMPEPELRGEMAAGVRFRGIDEAGRLVAVMGRQPVEDVTLIRHAYVAPPHQSRGHGAALLADLSRDVDGPLLVGTWRAAAWAIGFYRRHGFHLAGDEETDRLLRRYWTVSARQRACSVVLCRL